MTEAAQFRIDAREGSARLRDAIFKAYGFTGSAEPRAARPVTRKTLTPMRNGAIDRVVQVVAEHYRIPPAQVGLRSRAWDCSHPRQVAIYIARELHGVSFPALGRHFGQKDHTSAVYACRKVRKDERLLADARALIHRLKEPRKTGDNCPKSKDNHAIEQSMKTQAEMAA